MKTYPMRARIRNDGSGPAIIDIFDDIGPGGFFSDGLTAKAFAVQLGDVKGALEVHISSSGGDVFDGLAIAEAIRSHKGPVTTVVDGLAASIASVIFQAGQQRVMTQGSMAMIHDAFAAAVGNEAEMAKMAQTLGKVSDNLAAEYARRAGGTPEHWRGLMKAETWYTADEAVAAGLADRVGSGSAALPESLDVAELAAHAPARIMAALRSLPRAADGAPATAGQQCKTCKGRGRLKHPGTGQNGAVCPGCGGSGTYSPGADGDGDGAQDRLAALAGDTPLGSGWVRGADGKVRFDPDGDGDDDSTPEGDTDHDYFAPDGTPLKPVPPCPVSRDAMTEERVRALAREVLHDEVARMAAAKADESPWDAAKAWAAGSASDDPAKFFAGICAGEKAEGSPATQEHWALPYRYSPDSAPNAAAVRNCLARLGQTQGLKDPAAAKAKLHALMKQVNPDWEPEGSTDKSVFSRRLEQMRGAMPPLKGAGA